MMDESLRGLPLAERLRIHSERVARELPAWKILEQYDSDKTPVQLKYEIYKVQTTICRLETAIKVQQSREFLEARSALSSRVRELTKELLNAFAGNEKITDTIQLLRLKSLQVDVEKRLKVVQLICLRGGIDDEPHIGGATRILKKVNDACFNSDSHRRSIGPAINPCVENQELGQGPLPTGAGQVQSVGRGLQEAS